MQLSHEEHAYIVDNHETDMMFTEVGMRLLDEPRIEGGSVIIEVSQTDCEEFLNEVREEFLWKSLRLRNPQILIGLARRLLSDFESLEPIDLR